MESLEWIGDGHPMDRVRQLPAILAELEALDGTRNPGGETTHTSPVFGSKPPVNETVTFLLDGRENSLWGGLHRLQDVSRIVWQYLDQQGRRAHPQPAESSWSAEVAWLTAAWPAAALPQVVLDAACDQIDALYRSAAAAIGLRPPASIRCPQCSAHMTMIGDMLVCDAVPDHEVPGPERLEHQWRRAEAATAAELAEQLPINRKRINKWVQRRQLKPYLKGGPGRPDTYLPWDVIGCLWPGIVELIDKRDSAA